MTHDCVRRDAPFRTRLGNNGQRSVLVHFGYDVIDPTRTCRLPGRANAFDDASAAHASDRLEHNLSKIASLISLT